jgi:hypothetical protein
MSNENKNNNENIEQQTTSKHWWKKLLGLNPTYKLRIYFLLFVILFIGIISSSCTNLVSVISDKGRWIVVKDTMDKPRFPATVNLLPDGNVLIMGGLDDSADTAEIFDPNQMKIIKSIPLNDKRYYDYSATNLVNGDVFIAGGYSFINMQGQKITNTTKIFDNKTYEFKDTKNMKYKMSEGNLAQLLSNGNVLLLSNMILTDISRENFRFQIYDPIKNDYYEVKNMIHKYYVGKIFFHLNNGNILFNCYGSYPNRKDKGFSSWCLYNVKDNKFEKYSDDIPSEQLFIQLDDENYLTIKPELTYSSGYTYNINTKEKTPVKNRINRTWRPGIRPQSILLNNGNVLILGIILQNSSDEYENRNLNRTTSKYSAYIYDRNKNEFFKIPAPPYPVYDAGIVMLQNGDILIAGGRYKIRPKQIGAISSNKIQIFKYNK